MKQNLNMGFIKKERKDNKNCNKNTDLLLLLLPRSFNLSRRSTCRTVISGSLISHSPCSMKLITPLFASMAITDILIPKDPATIKSKWSTMELLAPILNFHLNGAVSQFYLIGLFSILLQTPMSIIFLQLNYFSSSIMKKKASIKFCN